MNCVTEGWLEIDKHYSLELCFSIDKCVAQPAALQPACTDLRLTVFRFFRAAKVPGRAVILLYGISSVSSLANAPRVSGSWAVNGIIYLNGQLPRHRDIVSNTTWHTRLDHRAILCEQTTNSVTRKYVS